MDSVTGRTVCSELFSLSSSFCICSVGFSRRQNLFRFNRCQKLKAETLILLRQGYGATGTQKPGRKDQSLFVAGIKDPKGEGGDCSAGQVRDNVDPNLGEAY